MSGATFDRTCRYRYNLWRSWDKKLPAMAFLMLNPSKADAVSNDQTISTCLAIARRLGYGGVEVVNLFAYCATQPTELMAARHPVGKANDEYIVDAIASADTVLLAWGNHGALKSRSDQVLQLIDVGSNKLFCLGKTKKGHPRHPLYLPSSTPLVPFFTGVDE